MLYDPDTSYSAELGCDASSSVSEEFLLNRLARLNQAKPNAKLADKQKVIHFMQEKHIRLPHIVVRYGTQLIKNAASRLGNAVWDMYERVFVASLDAHDYPVATWCLSTLDSQWPGSSRVARLKGMNSEARGHYSSAADLYTEFLADEPTNIGMLRRQVACAKGAGDLAGAITLLNKYVKIYSSDENAWLELSELYVQSSQIDLASFALEELIMLAPENYVYHLKYADLQYTLGAYDIARQYYAQSLELKPKNNLRALYGLVLSLKTKSGAANAPNPQGLYTWTAEQIIAHYNKYQPSLVDIAKATITGEGNNPTITSNSTSSPLPSPSAATAATTSSAHSQEEPREVQPTELPD